MPRMNDDEYFAFLDPLIDEIAIRALKNLRNVEKLLDLVPTLSMDLNIDLSGKTKLQLTKLLLLKAIEGEVDHQVLASLIDSINTLEDLEAKVHEINMHLQLVSLSTATTGELLQALLLLAVENDHDASLV